MGCPFFRLDCKYLINEKSKLISPGRIFRDIFDTMRNINPAILFIDNIHIFHYDPKKGNSFSWHSY